VGGWACGWVGGWYLWVGGWVGASGWVGGWVPHCPAPPARTTSISWAKDRHHHHHSVGRGEGLGDGGGWQGFSVWYSGSKNAPKPDPTPHAEGPTPRSHTPLLASPFNGQLGHEVARHAQLGQPQQAHDFSAWYSGSKDDPKPDLTHHAEGPITLSVSLGPITLSSIERNTHHSTGSSVMRLPATSSSTSPRMPATHDHSAARSTQSAPSPTRRRHSRDTDGHAHGVGAGAPGDQGARARGAGGRARSAVQWPSSSSCARCRFLGFLGF
jgi:hypothetical protein